MPSPSVSDVPPDVCTVTCTVPSITDDGTDTVIVDGFTTTGLDAVTLPNLTIAPVTNPVPVMVTGVPPARKSSAGLTVATVGCGATKSRLSESESIDVSVDVPSATVTTTLTVPGVMVAGATAMSEVGVIDVTLAAASVPKRTVAPATNPVPVMVTAVPPTVDTEPGDTEVMVGRTSV